MNSGSLTKDMLRFKEATRHLWNTYLLDSVSPMSPDLQLSFEKIEQELLRSIVLLPNALPVDVENYRHTPTSILLHPKPGLTEIPVQFGAVDANKNMIWELPSQISAVEVSQFRFIAFFDWNPYGYIDLGYIKAATPGRRRVLVSQIYCDFVVADQIQ